MNFQCKRVRVFNLQKQTKKKNNLLSKEHLIFLANRVVNRLLCIIWFFNFKMSKANVPEDESVISLEIQVTKDMRSMECVGVCFMSVMACV